MIKREALHSADRSMALAASAVLAASHMLRLSAPGSRDERSCIDRVRVTSERYIAAQRTYLMTMAQP